MDSFPGIKEPLFGVSRHSLQRGEPAHRGGSPSGGSGVILEPLAQRGLPKWRKWRDFGLDFFLEFPNLVLGCLLLLTWILQS